MNQLDRRGFLAVLGVGAAATACGRSWGRSASGAMYFKVVAIGRGTQVAANAAGTPSYVNLLTGAGGNALLVVEDKAPENWILIDAKNAPFGTTLYREVSMARAVTEGKGLRTLINTHHHADHTGGNHAFVGRVPVLAHRAALARVESQADRYKNATQALAEVDKDPKAAPAKDDVKAFADAAAKLTGANFKPDQAATGDSQTLSVGGLKAEIRHFGAGHTDNDLVVRFPALNVVHMGDLLFRKLWPFFDRSAGATTAGWIKSLEMTLELCDAETVVVPGHGDLTDRQGIADQIDFLKRLRDAAEKAVAAGVARDDFVKSTPAGFEGTGFEMIRPVSLGGAFDEAAEKAGK